MISSDVAAISGTARATCDGAQEMGELAGWIQAEADALGGAVSAFLTDLRAA
jgi:hypothetical protein